MMATVRHLSPQSRFGFHIMRSSSLTWFRLPCVSDTNAHSQAEAATRSNRNAVKNRKNFVVTQYEAV